MLDRYYLRPDDMWWRVENDELLYTPIVVVRGAEHSHIYLSGQLSRLPSGEVIGIGDMRAEIRQICENIKTGLNHVGATFDDVTRSATYVVAEHVEEYYAASAERFKYFNNVRPTSTVVPVVRLGKIECKVEIECEAIIESERLPLGDMKQWMI